MMNHPRKIPTREEQLENLRDHNRRLAAASEKVAPIREAAIRNVRRFFASHNVPLLEGQLQVVRITKAGIISPEEIGQMAVEQMRMVTEVIGDTKVHQVVLEFKQTENAIMQADE